MERINTIEFRGVLARDQFKNGKWHVTYRDNAIETDSRIIHFTFPLVGDTKESLLAGIDLIDLEELERIDICLK